MEQGVVPLITHTASGRRLTRLNVVICQEAINAQLIDGCEQNDDDSQSQVT